MAFVNCKGLTYAKVATSTTGSAVTYTGGKALTDYLCKVDMGEERADVKEHADGHQIDAERMLNNATVALELAATDNDIRKDLLGYSQSGTGSNIVKKITDADPPFVGVGFILANRHKGTTTYEAWWYYKVQFTSGGVSVSTRREQTEFQHETINGTAMGVVQAANGPADFVEYSDGLQTEAAARTWLNTKAGITGGG